VPLVACPKCSTNLKIPDGASGNVKCPKCATVFPVAAKPVPAFEVVEEAPPRPAAKPQPIQPDFDVVEEPRPKKKVIADDDDDDRPRGRRRRDDDDDDYDDRPRCKKRRRDYDDDEDDWQPAGKAGAGPAKVGALMLVISLWMYFATFAVLALFMFIAWLGGYVSTGLMVIPGILGLANWVCAAVGLGFSIAGPARSRGLAIAATAVAGVHLILAFVIANNTDAGLFSDRSVQRVGLMTKSSDRGESSSSDAKRREAEAKERVEFMKEHKDELMDLAYYEARLQAKGSEERELIRDIREPSAMRWSDLSTLIPFADDLIAVLSYHNKLFGDYIFGFLGGLLEVARLILVLLLIGSLGRAVKGYDAAEKAKYGLIGVCIAVGVTLLISLLVSVIIDSAQEDAKKAFENNKPSVSEMQQDPSAFEKAFKAAQAKAKSAQSTTKHTAAVGGLLTYLIYAGMLVVPVLAAHGAYSAAARRAR
jgi:LSD1 subclass zinc finger protein